MLAFAKAEFVLQAKQTDGATLRAHLQIAAEQLGYLPEELRDAPALPFSMEAHWRWFTDLHFRRSSNGYSPNPISFTELDAWSRLRGVQLSTFDVDAIMQLDTVYFAHLSAPNTEA